MHRIIGSLLFLFQVVALSASLTLWWNHKDNHLFGNDHWLVGKNMGKFVFYTFQFMFHPLEDGRVNLNERMGNQELLYHLPEDETRMLTEMAFESAVSSNAYLWLEVQKTAAGMLACRLSSTTRYQSGFYTYDGAGRLIHYVPLEDTAFMPPESWSRYRLIRESGAWLLFCEGRRIGSLEDTLSAEGYFGFRGSGNITANVYIRDISLSFSDPKKPTTTWTHNESFRRTGLPIATLLGISAVAFAVIVIRFYRHRLLASTLSSPADRRFRVGDNTIFSLLLATLFFLPASLLNIFIPACLAAGELGSVISLRAARGQSESLAPSRNSAILTASLLLLFGLILAAGLARHGEWLGRAERSIWSNLENIHPSAFILFPSGENTPPEFAIAAPVELVPGKPLYTGDMAFRHQRIDVEFDIPPGCTFDLVFQQQSYQTYGDPQGEPLPLQRRLLRLSTREDVPWGLSSGKRTRTAPFLMINGELFTDRVNTLRLVQARDSLSITLNGAETVFADTRSLGYGETGFGVFEKRVLLHTLQITALENQARQQRFLPLLGFLLPLAVTLLLWLVLFPVARASLPGAARLAAAVLFLPVACTVFTLPLPTGDLIYLGAARLVWFDLALVGAALSLFHLFGLFHGRIRLGAIVSNILLLTLFFFLGLFGWDHLLPDNHPLRLQFSKNAIAPAETIEDNHGVATVWYSNNRLAVANTYVWHQRFGGEAVAIPKPEGTIRIFTMGGSQAWGSGAADSSSTYAALLERKLHSSGHRVEVYNAGVNGAGISRVYTAFRDLILPFEPDILIADVGLNDSVSLQQNRDPQDRQKATDRVLDHYSAIVRLCRQHNVRLVLAQEAMNMESALRQNTRLYEKMAEETVRGGYTVVDSYAFFSEHQNEHMYWWDPAHFSPAGHQAFAALLYPPVENAIATMSLAKHKVMPNDEQKQQNPL